MSGYTVVEFPVETHQQYVQRVGAPRVGACAIVEMESGLWGCGTHLYLFTERLVLLDDRPSDRCPMSRLEEYRAKRWELAA